MRSHRGRRGFTLLEMLAVIAIFALLLAVAVPSVLAARDALIFQERNGYARSVFLGAQAHLTQLRRRGDLESLPQDKAAVTQADGESLPAGCLYAMGTEEGLLPAGAVEEMLRLGSIIEYDPKSGNVRAVFYHENAQELLARYEAGLLSREEAARRQLGVGYYDGSDLGSRNLAVYEVAASLEFLNGQEGLLVLRIPTKTEVGEIIFTEAEYDRYVEGLKVQLRISGEHSGAVSYTAKEAGVSVGYAALPDAVELTFPLDSLMEGGGFWENDGVAAGDNVSILAEVTFCPEVDEPMVIVRSTALAGVNPMFASLAEGSGGHILTVSNGRHLQNLHYLDESIAGRITAILFTAGESDPGGKGKEILLDWAETESYYQNRHGSAPGFVPISNPALRAQILGRGVQVRNLCIDTDGAAGLFGELNCRIDGVYVVNPRIRSASGPVGALAGRIGENAYITNCGSFLLEDGMGFVSGSGKVGGLIGSMAGGWVKRCIAAVPVSGSGTVGGFAGSAEQGTLDGCVAFGSVETDGYEYESFCGAAGAAGDHCYFLSRYDPGLGHNWVSRSFAQPVTRETMVGLLESLGYAGELPEDRSYVGIAYFERYQGETGTHYACGGYSTLKDGLVTEDGYVLLSARPLDSISVAGEVAVLQRLPDVTVDDDAYRAYLLPLDVYSGDGFYTEVTVNDGIQKYTLYYHPNTALSVSDAGGAQPETVFIRSPRQLALLGSDAMAAFRGGNFVQQLDIDFDAANMTHMAIGTADAPFQGRFDGNGRRIAGADCPIFGVIGEDGLVMNCHVTSIITANGAGPVGVLAGELCGRIEGYSVAGSIYVSAFADTGIGTVAGSVIGGSIGQGTDTVQIVR